MLRRAENIFKARSEQNHRVCAYACIRLIKALSEHASNATGTHPAVLK